MEQEEKSCDEVETVREFTYLGDSVGAGGGCEFVVTARTRNGWIRFREYCELLCGKRFPLKLNEAVYDSYVRPVILYAAEALCQKKGDIRMLRRAEGSILLAMC